MKKNKPSAISAVNCFTAEHAETAERWSKKNCLAVGDDSDLGVNKLLDTIIATII